MGGLVRNEAGGVNDLGAQKGFGGLLRGCEGAMLCFAVDFWSRGAFCRVLGCWGWLEAAAMLPANQPGLAVPAGGPAPSSPILPAQYHSLACPGCCCLSITPQQIEGLGPIPCNAAPQGGLIPDPGGGLLWPPSHGSSPPAQVPGLALGFVAWTSCVPAQLLHSTFLSPQICIAQGSSCQTTSPARLRKLPFGDKCAPNLSPGTAGTNWGVGGGISQRLAWRQFGAVLLRLFQKSLRGLSRTVENPTEGRTGWGKA